MTRSLRPLAEADPIAVEHLLDRAFGADRSRRTAYRIRAGMLALPQLSFAVFDGGTLVGTLQSWPVAIADVPIVLVGPVAVPPSHQRAGIGQALMTALIVAGGKVPMTMIGDPEYYGRFGFAAGATAHWEVPGPVEARRLLARHTERLPTAGRLGPRNFAVAEASA